MRRSPPFVEVEAGREPIDMIGSLLYEEMKENTRPDRNGTHRGQFEKNKKKIYATQEICGICGKPVDFKLKYPHPMSKCIDHIIPISKGGHPSDINNMQLAHRTCNRTKGDLLPTEKQARGGAQSGPIDQVISNRVLPQSLNWSKY